MYELLHRRTGHTIFLARLGKDSHVTSFFFMNYCEYYHLTRTWTYELVLYRRTTGLLPSSSKEP